LLAECDTREIDYAQGGDHDHHEAFIVFFLW